MALHSGGASAVKEPGHFEVRKSSSQVTRSYGFSRGGGALFPQKSWQPFSVVALKTQAPNAADCFMSK